MNRPEPTQATAAQLSPFIGTWALSAATTTVYQSLDDIELGWDTLDAPQQPGQGLAAAQGLTLTIHDDGTFTEDLEAEHTPLDWFDTEAVICGEPATFDGQVLALGDQVFVVPVDPPCGYLSPRGHIRGNDYDSFVTDALTVEDGSLLRCVTAMLDGDQLNRIWYRYQPSSARSTPRPVRDHDQPMPTLQQAENLVLSERERIRVHSELRRACAAQSKLRAGVALLLTGEQDGSSSTVQLLPGLHYGPSKDIDRFDDVIETIMEIAWPQFSDRGRLIGVLAVYRAAQDQLQVKVFAGETGLGFFYGDSDRRQGLAAEFAGDLA